ncbi:hypothetical protein NHX12_019077 [Muraenolepis orangiensis]|uniref:Galectin n=1 Tax=Muraenolepis orangiensis TaxID=630683 RepID=A0A9Q0IVQ9_9TELE|nr:hypothetical protein NHX12_019077 [Muraenolepis orangiensis]
MLINGPVVAPAHQEVALFGPVVPPPPNLPGQDKNSRPGLDNPPSQPGLALDNPPSQPGLAQDNPPSQPGLAQDNPPSQPGLAQDNPPSQPGLAQDNPPIRACLAPPSQPGLAQDNPPSQPGLAQDNPPIRACLAPPSQPGLAQDNPPIRACLAPTSHPGLAKQDLRLLQIPQGVTMDLTSGRDIVFHLNVRFNDMGKKVIVRNSEISKKWGKEERGGSFPFVQGKDFEMKILCTGNGYRIAVNGSHLLEFQHRCRDLRSINHLSIYNDLTLKSVSLEKLP